jgi:hypothetical protein
VHLAQLALDVDDALAELAAVALELGLTGAAEADATDSLAGEVGPQTSQPRQPIFELGQFDLQAPFVGRGAAGEDVEDERSAVDDFDVQRALEIPLLGWCEVVIDHDDVVVNVGPPVLDFLELSLADVGASEGVGELLSDRADDLDVDGLGQAGELFQRIGGGPGLAGALDGDQERMLGGLVGRKRIAWYGSLLGTICNSAERSSVPVQGAGIPR